MEFETPEAKTSKGATSPILPSKRSKRSLFKLRSSGKYGNSGHSASQRRARRALDFDAQNEQQDTTKSKSKKDSLILRAERESVNDVSPRRRSTRVTAPPTAGPSTSEGSPIQRSRGFRETEDNVSPRRLSKKLTTSPTPSTSIPEGSPIQRAMAGEDVSPKRQSKKLTASPTPSTPIPEGSVIQRARTGKEGEDLSPKRRSKKLTASPTPSTSVPEGSPIQRAMAGKEGEDVSPKRQPKKLTASPTPSTYIPGGSPIQRAMAGKEGEDASPKRRSKNLTASPTPSTSIPEGSPNQRNRDAKESKGASLRRQSKRLTHQLQPGATASHTKRLTAESSTHEGSPIKRAKGDKEGIDSVSPKRRSRRLAQQPQPGDAALHDEMLTASPPAGPSTPESEDDISPRRQSKRLAQQLQPASHIEGITAPPSSQSTATDKAASSAVSPTASRTTASPTASPTTASSTADPEITSKRRSSDASLASTPHIGTSIPSTSTKTRNTPQTVDEGYEELDHSLTRSSSQNISDNYRNNVSVASNQFDSLIDEEYVFDDSDSEFRSGKRRVYTLDKIKWQVSRKNQDSPLEDEISESSAEKDKLLKQRPQKPSFSSTTKQNSPRKTTQEPSKRSELNTEGERRHHQDNQSDSRIFSREARPEHFERSAPDSFSKDEVITRKKRAVRERAKKRIHERIGKDDDQESSSEDELEDGHLRYQRAPPRRSQQIVPYSISSEEDQRPSPKKKTRPGRYDSTVQESFKEDEGRQPNLTKTSRLKRSERVQEELASERVQEELTSERVQEELAGVNMETRSEITDDVRRDASFDPDDEELSEWVEDPVEEELSEIFHDPDDPGEGTSQRTKTIRTEVFPLQRKRDASSSEEETDGERERRLQYYATRRQARREQRWKMFDVDSDEDSGASHDEEQSPTAKSVGSSLDETSSSKKRFILFRKPVINSSYPRGYQETSDYFHRAFVKKFLENNLHQKLTRDMVDMVSRSSKVFVEKLLKGAEDHAKARGKRFVDDSNVLAILMMNNLIESKHHWYQFIQDHLPDDYKQALIPRLVARSMASD